MRKMLGFGRKKKQRSPHDVYRNNRGFQIGAIILVIYFIAMDAKHRMEVGKREEQRLEAELKQAPQSIPVPGQDVLIKEHITLADAIKNSLIIRDIEQGEGNPAGIGDEITIEYRISNDIESGQDTEKQWQEVKFTLGKDTLPIPFMQAVIGMKPGGKREVIIPAEYLAPYLDNEKKHAISLPGNKIIKVEVLYKSSI